MLAPPVVRLSEMRLSVRVPVVPTLNLMPPPMFAVPPWKATLVPAKVLLLFTSTAPPPTAPEGCPFMTVRSLSVRLPVTTAEVPTSNRRKLLELTRLMVAL